MRHDSGQMLSEVAVVTLFVTLALCTPWLDGDSPAEMLLASIAALTGSYIDWLKVF